MAGVAVTLALLASLAYGSGTALSRAAVRRHTATSVALWVQAVGLTFLAASAVATRPTFTPVAILWGLAAGALAAAGVLAFYTAMQNGPISLVAPVASSGVIIPVAGGLLLGEVVGRAALVGLVMVMVGVMVIARSHARSTSMSPTSTSGGLETLASPPGRSQVTPVHDNCKPSMFAHPHRVAVSLAAFAAFAFGSFYLVLRQASAAQDTLTQSPMRSAVVIALAVQAGSFMVTSATASRHTIRCVRPTRPLVAFAFVIGALDMAADLALTYAVAIGPVALVGPLGSLDPIVAVLLAVVVYRERLTWKRCTGLVFCIAGIVLIAT